VASSANRGDVLCAACSLLSAWIYPLQERQERGGSTPQSLGGFAVSTLCPYIVINDHSPRFYSLSGGFAVSILCLIAAVLAKESGVATGAVLILLEARNIYPERGRGRGRGRGSRLSAVLGRVLVVLIVIAGIGFFRFHLQGVCVVVVFIVIVLPCNYLLLRRVYYVIT
jgi:hypothetical protein